MVSPPGKGPITPESTLSFMITHPCFFVSTCPLPRFPTDCISDRATLFTDHSRDFNHPLIHHPLCNTCHGQLYGVNFNLICSRVRPTNYACSSWPLFPLMSMMEKWQNNTGFITDTDHSSQNLFSLRCPKSYPFQKFHEHPNYVIGPNYNDISLNA